MSADDRSGGWRTRSCEILTSREEGARDQPSGTQSSCICDIRSAFSMYCRLRGLRDYFSGCTIGHTMQIDRNVQREILVHCQLHHPYVSLLEYHAVLDTDGHAVVVYTV